jgi:hypothetical protein
MGNVRGLVLAAALVACNGDKDNKPDGNTETGGPTGPLHFTFLDRIPAEEYDSEIAPEALRAHQVSTMVLSAPAVVAADESVQDRLNTDGGGGAVLDLRAAAGACWYREPFPMFSFPIDYTNCSNYDMGGGVFVNDHPSGPLLFEFENFQIKEREIGGVYALDVQGAYPEPLYWQAYNTDVTNPGVDNPVQLGVMVDGESFGVSYSGGASVDFVTQEWATWGVMTIDGGTEPIQVVHGAATAAEVAPDEPTGTDVMKSSLNWLSCRCPTSGIQAQDLPLHFTSVTIDIDTLEDVPDTIDDPSFEIEVDYDLPGRAVLTHTGCGTYGVDYTSELGEVEVDVDKIIGAISFQCATLAIDDEERCAALLDAANRLQTLTVEVTPDLAQETAIAAVEGEFDGPAWCQVN